MSQDAAPEAPAPEPAGIGLKVLVGSSVLAILVGVGAMAYAVASYFGWLPEPRAAWETTPDPIPPPVLGGGPSPLLGLTPSLVADGLDQPVDAIVIPGTEAIYVLEKPGRVRLVEDGEVREPPVLDITDLLLDDGERGLVGIALHPDFSTNRRVFLSYTDLTTDLVIAEYLASPDGSSFGAEPVVEIMRVEQPGRYHHGGMITFGPDGFLWLGLGDGGGGARQDAFGHGQNPGTLKATISRIDIDVPAEPLDGVVKPYSIPAGNPFGPEEGAPEVWAFGLRNPWRFTIDDGLLYIADVGHITYEEINIVPLRSSAGANFGWSVFEGPECMDPEACPTVRAVEPVVVLPRGGLCAVIGGPVYRGDAIPELRGRYFYGDYCVGWVRSLWFLHGRVVEHFDWGDQLEAGRQLTSFAVDAHGEILVLMMDGRILRIDPVR